MWVIATLIGKNVFYKPRENSPVNKPYRKMEIDKKQPIIEKLKTLNYKKILKEANASGKPIKPVRRRKNKFKIPTLLTSNVLNVVLHMITCTIITAIVVNTNVKFALLHFTEKTAIKRNL